MKTVIFGAGNLLVSDEGFGVHLVEYLRSQWLFPEAVELVDGGTLGIMANHYLEAGTRLIVVDVIDADGTPGEVWRYELADLLHRELPVRLSPHQIGLQEILALAALRGRLPAEAVLYGVIPASYAAGVTLSPPLAALLPALAERLVAELLEEGHDIRPIPACAAPTARAVNG